MAAVALQPGHRPAVLTRGWWHTPRLLRALTALAVTTLLAAGAVTATLLGGARTGLDAIGHREAPQAVRSADLYFALNDMDAQVANLLLVGGDSDFTKTRTGALATYEQRRAQADADLQAAAQAATDPDGQRAVQTVLGQLGAYEALVARAELQEDQAAAPAGQPAPAALADYRRATDLLRTTLLPAADAVTDANDHAVAQSYATQRGDLQAGRWWLLLVGATALGALLLLQLQLTARFHRRISPPLAAAILLAAGALLAAAALTDATATHLDTAKRSAYDSVIALSRARAVAYDMNADESRYLTDPSRAAAYEQSFRAEAKQAEDELAAELRNVTFPGEQQAATDELAAYRTYQADDRELRGLREAGQVREAVAYDTGTAGGQSNGDFDRFAEAVGDTLALNQRAFDHELTAAEGALGVGARIAGGLVLGSVVGLVLLAVRPRLREFR
ncbi:hypothetical protein CFP65_3006 [Kitasatospora sp. MMS16-BH015]|uniref:hypothetical protein n=1 Tax=Kitasatospora sp. MMS16-BH015 TaxID=2018025 RepID=UPI000CA30965|nr:hypothetical protein [Kitasatospora sp. MMS16-BH015]AUG77816.1 hypothetical protein CFP65_3006 [Kitasatospora sp. MMS16-BH015]